MGGVNGPEEGVQSVPGEAGELRTQLKVAEAKLAGAAPYVAEVNARMRMLEGALLAYEGYADERDRYRSAWLSARRRAARESVYATEALALRDAEIADLRAQVRKSTHGVPTGPLHLGL